MKRLARLVLATAAMFAVAQGPAGAATVPDRPDAWILDQARVLNSATISTVDAQLDDFTRRTGDQIAVLTVATTGGQSIDDYANDVFQKWGVGDADKDNGVLMALAMNDRKGRIEVGYGAEARLTDIEAKRILDEQVFPQLKANNPNQAVLSGTQAIRAALGDSTASVVPVAPTIDGDKTEPNFAFSLSEKVGKYVCLPLWFGFVFLFVWRVMKSLRDELAAFGYSSNSGWDDDNSISSSSSSSSGGSSTGSSGASYGGGSSGGGGASGSW